MDLFSFLLGSFFSSGLILIYLKLRVKKMKKAGLMTQQRRPKGPIDINSIEEVDFDDVD